MNITRLISLSIFFCTLSVVTLAQSNEILIRNATIMTASHGTITNGSILIRDGKIVAVDKADKVKASPQRESD